MQASPMAQYRIIVEGVADPVWLECLGGWRSPSSGNPGSLSSRSCFVRLTIV